MSFLPLKLGVRQSSDAEKGAVKDSSKPQLEKALRRDDYTCRFCGFRAQKYQRVMPYANDDASLPFVTACTFCEQCQTLERAGMMGSGLLIWLPEIEQAELNHIARAIYVARSGGGPIGELAGRALEALTARRSDAKKRLGGSDDPLLLATVLHESLTPEEGQAAADKLDGIRFLPLDKHLVRGREGDTNHFPEIVKYWRSPDGPFAHFPTDKWADMLKSAAMVAGKSS